jgi:hypothetical protein
MKRLGTSFGLWFCRTSETVSPSLFEPYNLNHVSVFSVTLRLSCLPLVSLPLMYPSRHHLIQGCWLINIRDSVFFYFTLLSHQSFYFVPKFFFTKVFFTPPPLGLVTHFSLSSTLFTFLTSFSQLAFLPVCSLLWPLLPLYGSG